MGAEQIANINPWAGLGFVIWLTLPLVVFSLGSAIVLHLAFVVWPPHLPKWLLVGNSEVAKGNATYLVLTAMFGLSLGALVKLIGGFEELVGSGGDSPTDIAGAIVSVIVLVLGTVGSLFGAEGKGTLQRPLGGVSFLLSFLVSGFYFQYLILTRGM
ncbi:MAG: hypothetical protein EOP22_10610 [Hyphomicrobiales bacterium]|nr:MAG: hypothetical protein EOP22_10610 [Hyphomicrobiales bacterium]